MNVKALIALGVCLMAMPAAAQVSGVLGTVTNRVLASTVDTAGSDAVELLSSRTIGVYPTAVATNAATANVTFRFGLSYDGTNWTTIIPAARTVTMALNGTTPVRDYLAIDVSGAKYFKLLSISNAHTAAITNTAVGFILK